MYLASPDRYTDRDYRRVGRSGLKLPRISLGLWQNFGSDRSLDTQRTVLRHAFDHGITHFDLANNYGPPPGAAETVFGRIWAEDFAPYRDEILISTKAGYAMWDGPYGEWGSRKHVLSSLDQSLARTGLDYVDVFYSHRPDPETPLEETMGALAHAVRQGKALYVGVSNYSPEQTAQAAAILAEERVPLLLHQPRYSIYDRTVEGGLLDTLGELGIGSIVFSPLAQGLLTDRYIKGDVPSDSRAASSVFLNGSAITPEYLQSVRALNDIAAAREQSLAQMSLAWVLRQPGVTSALVGASSTAQLDQNLAALDSAPFTEAELAAILAAAELKG